MPRLTPVLAELRRAWPYALVLALGLGATVAVGANLSNATPSADRPFGWPGPSSFENGVAMVRPLVVLAASLPALCLGATLLRGRDARAGFALVGPAVGVDLALLGLAPFGAALLGAWGSAQSPFGALVAFTVAHALLAWSFYCLSLFIATLASRHALPAALAAWVAFNAVYENAVRWAVFRQAGYEAVVAGAFPPWFYVSQVFSPLSAYRGALILWRPGFMDYVEKAVLTGAQLPAWMVPSTFIALMLALWVALPLSLGALVWWLRGRAGSPALGITPRTPSEMQP